MDKNLIRKEIFKLLNEQADPFRRFKEADNYQLPTVSGSTISVNKVPNTKSLHFKIDNPIVNGGIKVNYGELVNLPLYDNDGNVVTTLNSGYYEMFYSENEECMILLNSEPKTKSDLLTYDILGETITEIYDAIENIEVGEFTGIADGSVTENKLNQQLRNKINNNSQEILEIKEDIVDINNTIQQASVQINKVPNIESQLSNATSNINQINSSINDINSTINNLTVGTIDYKLPLMISKQKFKESTVHNNQRVNVGTGELFASSGFHTTDFIPIDANVNSIIIAKSSSAGGMNPNNIAYYNENKVVISGQNTGTLTPDDYGRLNLTPPANAKFLRYSVQGVYQRLGIFFNTYSDNFNYYEYYEFDKSKLFGKKVVAYGDSLVGGASNSISTWLGMTAKQFAFEPVNRGIGGSTVLQSDTERIAWVSDGTNKTLGEYGEYVSRPTSLNDGSGQNTGTTQPAGTVEILSSMCTDARVNTIPTDSDVIIILAGTNGMDEESYRLMLQKIYTRCPNAIIFCCTIPFRYNDANRTQITNTINANTTIKNVAKEFGTILIDLKELENINHYNSANYMMDNVHANNNGNIRRASVIGSKLNTFLNY